MLEAKITDKGIVFKVYIQPRASANQFAGCRQGALKIRITAPPADGKANRECLKFLAGHLKVQKSDMEIISGATGREKKILVRTGEGSGRGQTADGIKKRLETFASKKGG